MTLAKETQEKLSQLQMQEQNIQSLLSQKQTFQQQQIEIESALTELEKTETAFRIVGNIMVQADKVELKDELEQKKKVVELRIKAIEKQETAVKEKASKLQEEVLKEMKSK